LKYKIVLHYTEEGYSVFVPDLPGCWSQGTTEKEAIENIEIAFRKYREATYEISLEKEYHDPEIDRIWAEEAVKRFAAYREGRMDAIPYEMIMEKYRRERE
jgi:predicted RNase H-like HicB family nuclease